MSYYLLWSLTAVLYSPVLFQLYHGRLELIDYTHAYFILPACLLITWIKRKELFKIPQSPNSSFFSLVLFLIGLFLFIIGWRQNYLSISTFSMIPVLAGLLWFLYGAPMLKAFSFPLMYLLFMVPPPMGILDELTTPMRYGVSKAAVFILQSFSIPAHREGLLIFLGNQEVFIAPACSGFRSLITFLALSALYVYLIRASLSKKFILILSVIPLALIGNLIRVLVLCLITYTFGEETGQGFLHEFSGILIFAIIITGFLMIDLSFQEDFEG